MKYCLFCNEANPDDLEVCSVCGARFEDSSTAAPPVLAPPSLVPEPAAAPQAPPTAPVAEPRPIAALDEAAGTPAAGSPAAGSPAAGTPAAEPVRPPAAPTKEEIEAEKAYRQAVARINEHLQQGFDLFGLVGHAMSGKTHSLKALTYLLKQHGVGGQRAHVEFRKVPVPATSGGSITDYAYTGPGGEKWVIVDVGGELYFRMQNNDWKTRRASSAELSHWLNECKGLFMYLHLHRGHFGQSWVDLEEDPDDEDQRQEVRRKRQKAQEAHAELEFFRHFLLFLRALKYEKGDVERVIERCDQSPSLEEALRYYHGRAPLLDIPVMFFFTKADLYDQQGFEISDGLQMNPRNLPLATAPFVARHLPHLFSSLLSQVRRFKFDFLQSYEENDSGQKVVTLWSTTEETLLSVGLLSGLEFILRNQTAGRRWWQGPGLDTRRALLLHRLLHPRQWRGVRVGLGSWGGRADEEPAADETRR